MNNSHICCVSVKLVCKQRYLLNLKRNSKVMETQKTVPLHIANLYWNFLLSLNLTFLFRGMLRVPASMS